MLYQTASLQSHVYHLIDYQEVIIRFVSLCQTSCNILLLRIQISLELCVLPGFQLVKVLVENTSRTFRREASVCSGY